MALKKTEEAKKAFFEAWNLAQPDGLVKIFGVHHKLLSDLVETYIKKDYPVEYKKITAIIKEFKDGWNKLHVPNENNLFHLLSPMEATIAILYNRGWQKKEMSAHLGISLATVKKHIQVIYELLNIQNKSALNEYLSK